MLNTGLFISIEGWRTSYYSTICLILKRILASKGWGISSSLVIDNSFYRDGIWESSTDLNNSMCDMSGYGVGGSKGSNYFLNLKDTNELGIGLDTVFLILFTTLSILLKGGMIGFIIKEVFLFWHYFYYLIGILSTFALIFKGFSSSLEKHSKSWSYSGSLSS